MDGGSRLKHSTHPPMLGPDNPPRKFPHVERGFSDDDDDRRILLEVEKGASLGSTLAETSRIALDFDLASFRRGRRHVVGTAQGICSPFEPMYSASSCQEIRDGP